MVTRDRPKLLFQTLKSLFGSTDSSQFNLTVFDDGSNQETLEFMGLALPYPSPKYFEYVYLPESDHNLGELKTKAVKHSEEIDGRGDWLCLIDNDVYFQPDWLPKMIEAATISSQYRFELWGGQNHPFHGHYPLGFTKLMEETDTLAGTHMFMSWETWDVVTPLKSAGPGVCQGEDVELCKKVHAARGRIGVLTPPVVVDCGITQTNGQPCPGADIKRANMIPGIYYE